MNPHIRWLVAGPALLCIFLILHAAGGRGQAAGADAPEVPRVWDQEALRAQEVPLTRPEDSARYFVDADLYYRIPVRPILKSYPVYLPSREPAGYLKRLEQQQPEVAFDPAKLKTRQDWIRAGELVFEAPIFYEGQEGIARLHDAKRYAAAGVPVAKDGTVPFNRYFVKEKGTVLVGQFSCSMCHTRVMPDGSVIKGAQGNFPLERLDAYDREAEAAKQTDARQFLDGLHEFARNAFGAPWLAQDPYARYAKLSFPEIQALWRAIPPGVQARFATSVWNPVQVPDLIGVKDRKYLDHTGLSRHRSIGDLMRYAVINQGGFLFAQHDNFKFNESLPPPEKMLRYSDEQVYALALFLYALQPPDNPHRLDAQAERGRVLFQNLGCGRCHTEPLYTNNKLTPVDGFTVPPDHPDRDNAIAFSLGTDPGLALATRRGTGFYKVPSLKGLWYRGPLQHSGQLATLEEWFDPRRLRDDFVSQGGFRLPGASSGAVRGHKMGLRISPQERRDLIAFLRTL
ncbi:MAG TPA: hypothetical protein VMW75_23055 [Thermoanaerobaculia bacterium]|nr:hypothetical protein [Thermoanaerobaculia bacterium]